MKMRMIKMSAAAWGVCAAAAGAQTPPPPSPPPSGPATFDLSKDKVLYCVGYAHLDTQWRWDFPTTIDRFILDTLDQNFALFEKHPGYVFNFTGSVRYEMMKEYYPERYERLKEHIAAGRWFVSGSSVDEGDANVPSPEAIIRQVLYGNAFFRREFGKESADFMLPDCFGFPASMPSIWAHCGLKGFSTQKLTWGSAVGIPFKVGVWEGLDGASVIAALDPGPYVGAIEGRVDLNRDWAERIERNGRMHGVWADYHYYGVGDQGGAPREEDVRTYLASIENPDSMFGVALVSSDQMFKDITPEQRANLPRYRGDLLLTEHSAGTLTSQSYMKRWNRKAEQLGNAAERAAVAADWLGGAEYPRERLERSWVRVLANQMHDILPGTSIPRAYTYSWNDEIIALNGFAAVLTDSIGAVARAMDTRVEGEAVIVYNPLAIEREDIVEARVRFPSGAPEGVRVFDHEGREALCQILERGGDAIRLMFLARTPPMSLSVFDVRPPAAAATAPAAGGLIVTERTLQNARYQVTINDNGDVASVLDLAAGGRELLAEPARLVFTREKPRNWPAWNMDWADRQKPPIDAVGGPGSEPPKIRIVERGPVRVAIEIERERRGSIFTQRISLAAGSAGERLEFDTDIDWQSTECALKASFPLTASNPNATYNWGMGTIARGNNEPTKYEAPSHEWLDLTDRSGAHGVSILEDSKYGSDKPSDNEVRLTLLYTPGVRASYLDQHSQDWGRHEMVYALYSHEGAWRSGAEWQGRRLNQPLRAFHAPKHEGALGRVFSLLSLNTEQVDVRAVKHAEAGEWMIVRLQELWGQPAHGVELACAAPILEAHEVDGQERLLGPATLRNGRLRLDMTSFSPRSFALRLAPPEAGARVSPPDSMAAALPFNVDVVSRDDDRADGALDDEGRTMPAEMLPGSITVDGVKFRLGPTAPGAMNAVACRGQVISLPPGAGAFDRVHILAAATGDEDVAARFVAGSSPHAATIQSWTGFVGQFDDRIWDREFAEIDHECKGNVIGFRTGFIKRSPIAWFCTHRHHPSRGNEAYRFSYLFKHGFDLPPGGPRTLTLPDDPRVLVFAVSVSRNSNDAVVPAAPLYDDFTGRPDLALRHVYPPPGRPVFDGEAPLGQVEVDRKASFEALVMGPPSASDLVDSSRGGSFAFRVFDGDGAYAPHSGSGVVDGALPRLNDGAVAQNDDDTSRCVWHDNEGRFFIDLGRPTMIERLNTYSWHRSDRAPQWCSIWGSNAEALPGLDTRAGETEGWTLLGVVDSRSLGDGGVHGSSVCGRGGAALGPFRRLLWITEPRGHGTFFTEIDIHEAK